MRWLALLLILLLAGPVLAGTATITIFGTNASNAQANLTNTGNQSINVTAWNVGGIKTFKVNVTNTSDTLTFNLYNVTAGQVNEFKVNGSAINGYQADSSGLVTFTRTQGTGNSTFNLAPAVNAGGSNFTWGWFQNLVSQTLTTIYNVSIYNATQIQGNGSGINNINASNITTGTFSDARLSASASNFNESYSYLIYTDGTTTYAMNGSTKAVDYSGTNENAVAQSVLDVLGNQTSYMQTINFIGTFQFSNLNVSNKNIILDFTSAYITPIGNYTIGVIYINGAKSIELRGGEWFGDSNNHTTFSRAIVVNNSNDITVTKANISDFKGVAIYGMDNSGTANNTNLKVYENNIVGTNQAAINLYYSPNSVIYKNTIDIQTLSADEAVDFNSGTVGSVIYDNIITYNGSQQAIDLGNDVSAKQNIITCTNSTYTGVVGINIESNSTVSLNDITDCNTGIDGSVSENNLFILGNKITNSNRGINIHTTNNTKISSNYLNTITTVGIRVYRDTPPMVIRDIQITDNIIHMVPTLGTDRGIELERATNSTISGNKIVTEGVQTITSAIIIKDTDSGNNTIVNNNIWSSGATISKNPTDYAVQNFGVSPFDFGNSATAPSPFGAGDTYFNSTRNYPCWRNATSWNRYNDSVGGC